MYSSDMIEFPNLIRSYSPTIETLPPTMQSDGGPIRKVSTMKMSATKRLQPNKNMRVSLDRYMTRTTSQRAKVQQVVHLQIKHSQEIERTKDNDTRMQLKVRQSQELFKTMVQLDKVNESVSSTILAKRK